MNSFFKASAVAMLAFTVNSCTGDLPPADPLAPEAQAQTEAAQAKTSATEAASAIGTAAVATGKAVEHGATAAAIETGKAVEAVTPPLKEAYQEGKADTVSAVGSAADTVSAKMKEEQMEAAKPKADLPPEQKH
jgi:hypothetical protein